MAYIDREVGQHPISIGTSFALEGFTGTHPNQPKYPPGHKDITEVWINLRTMVRNFYASMTTEQARKAPMDMSVHLILEELNYLWQLPSQSGFKPIVIYFNDLEQLRWDFRNATFKTPKTERQIYYNNLEALMLTQVLEYVQENRLGIMRISKPPAPRVKSVALLTHHVHELFWRFQFEQLYLLESHTGRLKSHSQWYTKLTGIGDTNRIPFNRITLQLFGDGTLFEGNARRLKDEMKRIAEDRKWTAVTTTDRLRDDVRNHGGKELQELVRKLT